MRELTGDGFGKKARDWNSPDQLAAWREQWANHQNRTLERHGHAARVDHRSFETQGIDREPTQHLGQTASNMERGGKASRIGNENRAIGSANAERAHNQIEAARLASQKARFETWAQEKTAELYAAQDLTRSDLDQRHHQQRQRLEARLEDDYRQAKATIKAELQAIDRRLEAKGVVKVLRDVFGRSRTDKTAREEMAASLHNIQTREAERRQALAAQQDKERRQLHERQEQRQQAEAQRIERARARADKERVQKATQKPVERSAHPFPTPPATTPAQPHERAAEPPEQSSERLSLDDKKRLPDTALGERGKLERPWQRASLSNDNQRPWQRDEQPEGRERRPDSPKTPKR